jgi:membrane associated rhomboid family serine protease
MSYSTLSGWGPDRTPTVIRNLILATCVISLFAALTEALFRGIFNIPGLQYWLSLSWSGFQHRYLWQLVTYMFVLNAESSGITLIFLITLAFNMYILWIMGSPLASHIGSPSFLRFYFLSGLFAAIVALFVMYLTRHYEVLSGPTPTLLALFTVWTMLNADAQLLLFFMIPLKAKWLLAGILGAVILISLSQMDWVNLFFNLSGAFFGYVYGLVAWDLRGPYDMTERLDQFIASLGKKIRKGGSKAAEMSKKSKIYDFKSGEPIDDDDQFIDSMLAKISKQGESSLTYRERRRMQEISEKKRKSQK